MDCLLCKGALPNCAGVGARTNGFSSMSFFEVSSLKPKKKTINISLLFNIYNNINKPLHYHL